jgi:uroporphyrinogen-III synthase
VDTLPLYETDFTDVTDAVDLKKFRELGADAIIFTSSSTALSYIEQEDDLVLDQEAIKPIICSFGPETSKTLLENELTVELECANPSIEDMTSRLVNYFS